jgi:hypothetical protein
VINLVKRLELGGMEQPLVSAEVRLTLSGIGQGTFNVRGSEPVESGILARFSMAVGGKAYPVLLGAVTDVTRLADGLRRVRVRELAAALESPAPLALRHVVPAQVLAALEEGTGVPFLLPTAGEYLRRRQPYFYSQGSARAALEQMAAVWQVPRPVWAQLPDGRIYWGDWSASPFNAEPLIVPLALVAERDDQGGALELPALTALRPGMVVQLDREDLRFMVRAATFREDRVRLEWDTAP